MAAKLTGFIILILLSAVPFLGCVTKATESSKHATADAMVTISIKGDTPIPDRFFGHWHEIDHVFKGSTNPDHPEVFKQDRIKSGKSKLLIKAYQISWSQEYLNPEDSVQGYYQVINNGHKIVFMIREVAYLNTETGEKGFRPAKIELTRDMDVLLLSKTSGSTGVTDNPGLFVSGSQVIFRYKSDK